jgi:hypothetical protein
MGWGIVVMDPVFRNACTNPHNTLSQSFNNFCAVILIVQQEPTLCEQYPCNQRSTPACISLLTWTCVLSLTLAIPNFDVWNPDHWKNQLLSPVTTRSISCGAGSTCSSISAQALNRAPRCEIPGHHLGTNFSHPQFFSLYQTNGLPVHVYHQQSFWLSLRIEHVLSPVLCCYLVVLLMAVRCATHLQHFVPAKGLCSWYCIISKGLLKFSMCCGGILTQKSWHSAARYSVLPFRQGAQTFPETSSTFSAPRHCKAMPLQMGMEEGTRPKAVCVNRLQYCQYSYEKVNLVSLLSDLVVYVPAGH